MSGSIGLRQYLAKNMLHKQPGFYEKLASYIENDFSEGQMYRAGEQDFPDAEISASLNSVSVFAQQPTTWRTFLELFGREHTEYLWSIRQRRTTRFLGRERKQKTLDEMLQA